jgi:hypothetical protein
VVVGVLGHQRKLVCDGYLTELASDSRHSTLSYRCGVCTVVRYSAMQYKTQKNRGHTVPRYSTLWIVDGTASPCMERCMPHVCGVRDVVTRK